jgi:MFS family permease
MTEPQPVPDAAGGRRFYPGCTVVIAGFIIMTIAMGVFNSFGIIFTPLVDQFRWSAAATAGAFSLSMLFRGLGGIVMGGLTDRFGPRLVLTLCGVAIGLGYLLLSRVTELWQIYLFYGVILGGGMSGIWVPLLSSIARWFDRRRAMMTGIVVAGVGLGGLIFPPLLTRLIGATDWRTTYLVQAGVVAAAVIIAARFLKDNPDRAALPPAEMPLPGETMKPGGSLTVGAALRTRQMWLILATLFFSGYIVFSLVVHLVPHALDLGVSPDSAATLLAVMNGISLAGIVLAGYVGDRWGSRSVFVISLAMMFAAVVVLAFVHALWLLYVAAIFAGSAFGAEGASESPLVARLFGLKSHGLIYGVSGIGFTGGTAVGPIITGYLYDMTGSYQLGFEACAAAAVLAIVAVLTLRPARKTEEPVS